MEFSSEIILPSPDEALTKLQLPEGIAYGYLFPATSPLPLIVDAIKPIFHLDSMGIRPLRIAKRDYHFYQLTPVLTSHCIYLPLDTLLSHINEKEPWIINHSFYAPPSGSFEEECGELIRYYFAFRDLLGIYPNTENVIHLRAPRWDALPYPISYQDRVSQTKLKETGLPVSVIKKWFKKMSVTDTICKLTDFDKEEEQIQPRLHYYRTRIEEVIKQIDANYIWYVDYIQGRLLKHYLRALSP